MIGFAGQSKGSVYNRSCKIIALQLGKKEEPPSSNAQLGKRQLKNWHVISVVAKGDNPQRSFENAHWIKARPKSDRNNTVIHQRHRPTSCEKLTAKNKH